MIGYKSKCQSTSFPSNAVHGWAHIIVTVVGCGCKSGTLLYYVIQYEIVDIVLISVTEHRNFAGKQYEVAATIVTFEFPDGLPNMVLSW